LVIKNRERRARKNLQGLIHLKDEEKDKIGRKCVNFRKEDLIS
jgi:hypothetical protein